MRGSLVLLTFLLGLIAVSVSRMLLQAALFLPLGFRPRRIDFGRPRILRLRVGGLALRLGPLPVFGSVEYARRRPLGPEERPLRPWIPYALEACIWALQVACLYAILGSPGVQSFVRGLTQGFWPWAEELRGWIQRLSDRAASGITVALVAGVAAKLLALHAVAVCGLVLARITSRLHRDRAMTLGVVLGLYVVVAAVWAWRVGVVLLSL